MLVRNGPRIAIGSGGASVSAGFSVAAAFPFVRLAVYFPVCPWTYDRFYSQKIKWQRALTLDPVFTPVSVLQAVPSRALHTMDKKTCYFYCICVHRHFGG